MRPHPHWGSRPNGIVVWRGPSQLDGKPIAAVVTGIRRRSANRATGPMLQVYILRTDVDPITAIREGKDASVCGDCPLRGHSDNPFFRPCHVPVGRSVLQVYRALKLGCYPLARRPLRRRWVHGRDCRIGYYGDPAAVPYSAWEEFIGDLGPGALVLSYTHQWRTCDPRFRSFCMASVETLAGFELARSRGWKPYYVRGPEDPIPPNTFTCPKSAEAGRRLTCQQCGACSGGTWKGQATPTTLRHGGAPNTLAFDRKIPLPLTAR